MSRNEVTAKSGNSVSDKFGDTVTQAAASDIAEKFGSAAAAATTSTTTTTTITTTTMSQLDQAAPEKEKKEKKKKDKKEKTAGPRPTTEEMIIVNVNDRLGTKASIPCLASDPISTSPTRG